MSSLVGNSKRYEFPTPSKSLRPKSLDSQNVPGSERPNGQKVSTARGSRRSYGGPTEWKDCHPDPATSGRAPTNCIPPSGVASGPEEQGVWNDKEDECYESQKEEVGTQHSGDVEQDGMHSGLLVRCHIGTIDLPLYKMVGEEKGDVDTMASKE